MIKINWNFNNNASVAAITTPTISNISGASLVANISGSSVIDPAGGTGSNFNLLNLNAQGIDPSGTHLRFNLPIGSALVFALPTTGHQNIVVKFATNRSGSGAGTQVWTYSSDGSTYNTFTNVTPSSSNPALATLDFSAITSKVRIVSAKSNFSPAVDFRGGVTGTSARNKIADNDAFWNNSANFYGNLTLSWNLFSGGNRKRAVQIAEIDKDIADIQIEDMQHDLGNRLANLYEFYLVQKELLAVAKENLQAAELNLQISKEKFGV